ncbi:MAG: glycosyltransferase family 39 protein [Bacteroidota bacterium]|jgi:Dolichyl-phosphate-mannose-protein mannosyltransferase
MIVAISSIITLVGLWCVLRKYFTTSTTFLTLFLLVFGTNFFVIMVYRGAVQASMLLALMVLAAWMTQRWHEKSGWPEAIIAGLAIGMQVFIKPAGSAAIFLFLFWGAYNKDTFKIKWKIFRDHPAQVLTIVGLFLWGIFLRIAYPQLLAGTWFCDYIPHTKALYLIAPWLWQVLFSIKNGWLIYTPVVLLSVPGFYILGERNKPLFYAAFIYSLMFLLLLASSPGVTVPDNFSQARMTEILAVLIIPLGYFTSWVLEGKWLRKTAFFLLFAMLISLNLFQTWQFRVKILNPWFTSTEYYKAVFLNIHPDKTTRSLQDFDNIDMSTYLANEGDFTITTKLFFDFGNGPHDFDSHIQNVYAYSGTKALRLDPNMQSTPGGNIKSGKLPSSYPLGLRLSAMVYSETDFNHVNADLIISLKHNGQCYRYHSCALQELNLVSGKWNSVKLDYVIPGAFDQDDEVVSSIWYHGDKALYVDDLKLELFEPKE